MSPERRDQIEQLYRSALELPLDKQPGFIADACIGDEELRLQVESLLNQYSANAKLLKQSRYGPCDPARNYPRNAELHEPGNALYIGSA
jgi:eukaryotic-like serine/threonine-protein kinase